MYEIVRNNVILARHIVLDDIKNGLNFFSKDSDFLQVGIWGNYESGKILNNHIHNIVDRKINRTHEVLYVIEGCIEASIYDLNKNFVETITVSKGEILVLMDCGHGYKVTSDNTYVLEIKNGPYLGADIDRIRF